MLEDTPVFDAARIRDDWGGADDETYRIILGIFVPEATRLCGEIGAGLALGDAPAYTRLAHTLRGAASNVCALRLAAGAGALEQAAMAGETARLAGLFAALEEALRTTLAVISSGGEAPGD